MYLNFNVQGGIMSKLKNFLNTTVSNLKATAARFPAAILFFAFISAVVFSEIENNSFVDDNFLARLAFTGIFGAFLSIAVEFKLERYEQLKKYSLFLNGSVIVLAAGYYFFMTSDTFSQSMFIHLFVIVFALFASYLYLPSAKNAVNFSNVALSHFKSAFISALYGVVLYLGLAAIITAIDLTLLYIN